MARLYPPVPRFELPDAAFGLVVALEEHLDDSYLILQPRVPLGGDAFRRGVDPVLIIHPTAGIAAVLSEAAAGLGDWSRQFSDRTAELIHQAQSRAGQWLGIDRNLILSLVHNPEAQSELGAVVSGEGEDVATQVRNALLRIKGGKLRPSPEDLDSVRVRFLGGDRLIQTVISPLQANYRDCKKVFSAMRAEQRGERNATAGPA